MSGWWWLLILALVVLDAETDGMVHRIIYCLVCLPYWVLQDRWKARRATPGKVEG